MNKIYLLVFVFISTLTVKSQTVSNYHFTATSNVALEDMSGSTPIFGAGAIDDSSSFPINLPFVFHFAGVDYTQFTVSTNGLIGFGANRVTAVGDVHVIDQSDTYPLVAPWWEDLYTARNGGIDYKIIGSTNRKLVIEFRVGRFKAQPLNYDKTFQVWLFEGSNTIQFVYGAGAFNLFTSSAVGIASASNDYQNVNVSNTTTSSTDNSNNQGVWPGVGQSYTFSPDQPLTVSISANGPTNFCQGSNVIFSSSVSQPGASFQWMNNNNPIAGATQDSYTATAAGSYSVTASNGFSNATSNSIVVNTTPIPLVSVQSTNVSCNGLGNGSATLSTDNNINYVFGWTGPNNYSAATSTIQNLLPGTYNYFVSTGGQCTPATGSVVISEPQPVSLSVTSANVTCNNAGDGHITVTTNGRYTIKDVNGADVSQQTNFAAGTYTITASANGGNTGDICSATASVSITQPSALNATAAVTNVSCNGNNNGSATISATGGTSPYTFVLNSVTNGNGLFTNLAAGSYSVSITDAHGCNTLVSVTISQPVALNASVTSANGNCNTTNAGSITISSPTGGSGSFEFRLNNGTWQTGTSFISLASGTYDVQMRDKTNPECSKDLGNKIISAAGTTPVVTIASSDPSNCSTLTLTASATGANSYTWSNGSTSGSIILNGSSADGSYSVTVTNQAGCTGSASYSYIKENVFSSYTVIGLKTVTLGESNTVNGAVGNAAPGQKITINKNSTVNGFVKGAVISLQQSVTITGGTIIGVASPAWPAVYYNTSSTAGLPNLTIPDNTTITISNNYNNITIGKDALVTITGNVYGTITLNQSADVIFTSPDISMYALISANGVTADYTTIQFAANSIVRIKNNLTLGSSTRLISSNASLYVFDPNSNSEQVTISSKDTRVNANIYLPTGIMNIRGDGQTAANATVLTGKFIAETINSDKYVTWNGYDCSSPSPNAIQYANNNNNMMLAPVVTSAPVIAKVEKVAVYPNPNKGAFRLSLGNLENVSRISIYDSKGVLVFDKQPGLFKGTILNIDLTNLLPGVYNVRITSKSGIQSTGFVIE